MSATHLNRKLKALLDQTPGQLIRSYRLKRAAEYLQQSDATIAEVAFRFGFADPANFSRSFKKAFGCSPTDYQQQANRVES
jgi:AraC-like DNA-binding protein